MSHTLMTLEIHIVYGDKRKIYVLYTGRYANVGEKRGLG